ncbi:MAG: permease [Pseudomonadota bacterium]
MKSFQAMLEFLLMDGALLIGLFFGITWMVVFLQQLGVGGALNARLSGLGRWRGAAMASVGGLVTPFCSCSTVPVLTGMLRADIRLSTSFAFLIASPVINEGVIALLLGKSGLMLALVYVGVAGFVTTLAGVLIETMGMARHLRPLSVAAASGALMVDAPGGMQRSSTLVAVRVAARLALVELRQVAPYLAIGLLIGSLIYGLVPDAMLLQLSTSMPEAWLVVVAALIGIPMYISPITVIPIGYALLAKGFPVGPLIAFLIAAAGTSVPEMILLFRIFKWQLVAAHVAVVTLSAVVLGYVIGALWPMIG